MTIQVRPLFLFLDEIQLADKDFSALCQVADIVLLRARTREEFLRHLKDGVYGNFVGIYRHFKAGRSIAITGRIDEQVVEAFPASMRYIAHNGAGYDQIDIAPCTAKGIQVANIQSVVDGPTADTAMFLILSCLRQFQPALEAARSGAYNSRLALSSDPKGKTLGILGLGGIGKALAARALAFGMIVTYHNRTRLSLDEEASLSVQYVDSMDDLFETSDVISIHVPLSDQTRHLVSASHFKAMKSSAVLINTARGPIIDEEAMCNALDAGSIGGVGLDVYEHEPSIPQALLSHPRAVCLPHVGTMTQETQDEMEATCLLNLLHTVQHGDLPYVVPEQRI